MGRLPAFVPRITTSREPSLEVADIPLCSGLQVCSPPRSFLPLRILPQGSRGFSIRAYRALLPPTRTGYPLCLISLSKGVNRILLSSGDTTPPCGGSERSRLFPSTPTKSATSCNFPGQFRPELFSSLNFETVSPTRTGRCRGCW